MAMKVDEIVKEYERRCRESILALLREQDDLTLGDLRELLSRAPELRALRVDDIANATRPAKLPRATPSVAVRVAGYLLDLAVRRGRDHGGRAVAKMPSHVTIAKELRATPEAVSLALAVLQKRDLVSLHPREFLVRDFSGLALLAERTLPRRRVGA